MFNEDRILQEIGRSRGPVGVAQLARILRVKGPERRELRQYLRQLSQQGKLHRVRGSNYTLPSARAESEVLGRLQVTSRGFGFVKPDWSGWQGEPTFAGDLHIPARHIGTAMDGDIVRAEIIRHGREGAAGRVTEVVERAHTTMVGWYQRTGKRGEVHPRSTRIDRRVLVPLPDEALGIKDFEWVEVEVSEFSEPPEPLRGKVVNRLGSDTDRGIDVLLVLRDRGIDEEFPVSVEEEAKALDFDWDRDMRGRKDLRKLPTLTIDPATAKDYDDGLSVERLDGGGWRLYVHIADVAHFVRPGTALDREAEERATSVYPVDRVVPMLPERLSNNLCSLVPHEDRLAVTAIMEFNAKGERTHAEFHSTAIHSDCRAAYEQIQALFDGSEPDTEPLRLAAPIARDIRELAAILRKRRFARGALDLDIPEVNVIFDEHGAVADLAFRESFEAHHLVEECMLAANEAVAEYLTERDAPLLYRIHETAEEERLERILPALRVFGIRLGRGKEGRITPKDLQSALDQAHQLPAGHVIRRLVLRSLQRAEYNPDNAGHFGLASECYCHFTSPIRRYPDVVVHRQLKALAAGKPLPYSAEENDLDALGEHTSSRERRAQEAEWEATSIKSLEFMKRHVGDEFDGYICGMQNWGFFVELQPHPVEGLIPVAQLKSDHYDLDETGVRLVGRDTKFVYKLGDKVKVRIDKADPLAQQLDLTLLSPVPKLLGKRGRRGGRR